MAPDPKPRVSFPRYGLSCEVDPGDSLVDAVFRYDLPVRFKCERAVCTTCLIEVLKGGGNLSQVQQREKQTLEPLLNAERFRLACQVEVSGDVELDYVPLGDPRRRLKVPPAPEEEAL